MNNITIHGRLTRDPELKEYTTKKGDTGESCKFSVAVDRRFGEETDFFNCITFGGLSRVIDKHFAKGKEIVVSGEMQCNTYTNDKGEKKYPWTLAVQNFDFC
ncbi:MAG: single-stranded DNA-binding protein, partial [Acetivibrio sp.]